MEKEDIEIIEKNIDYNSLLFGNGNANLSEKIRNAIRNLLQAYKEDESVIKEMAKTLAEIKSGSKYCSSFKIPPCKNKNIYPCEKCREEYFRKKVKDEQTMQEIHKKESNNVK